MLGLWVADKVSTKKKLKYRYQLDIPCSRKFCPFYSHDLCHLKEQHWRTLEEEVKCYIALFLSLPSPASYIPSINIFLIWVSPQDFLRKNATSSIFQYCVVQWLSDKFWSLIGSTCGSEFLGCVTLAKSITSLGLSLLITKMEVIIAPPHGPVLMT